MNIVLVGPAYPYRGGIADTNESFARSLQNLGQKVTIVTFTLQYPSFLFPGKTQFSEDPVPEDLHILRWINAINPLNWIRVAQKINRLKPDLVVMRFWIPFIGPSLGTIARFISSKTKLIAMCDNIIPHEKRAGDTLFTKYFLAPFQGFITLSEKVANDLRGMTKKPVKFFPHPINDNLGSRIDKAIAKEKLQLNPEGKYLLFFGLVRKYKGLDLLLEAMAEKELIELNVELIIAGEFYDNEDEYREKIRQLDIEKRVIIVNKFVPTADLPIYFSAVDLLTLTYQSATQSGVTLIGFNFDLPMLVTNVGGLAEIVHHNEFGYVCNKDPKEIAINIADYYSNNREASFRAKILVEKKKYSWEKFSQTLISLTDSI